jgi:hypothetical protein
VKPNHAGVQVTVVCIVLHHRTSLSNNDIKKHSSLMKYRPFGLFARGYSSKLISLLRTSNIRQVNPNVRQKHLDRSSDESG